MNHYKLLSACLILVCTLTADTTNWNYIVSTIAGHYPMGDGGPATEALLGFPQAMKMDSAGTLYIADSENNAVRRVAPDGTISSVAAVTRPSALLVLPDGVYVGSSSGVWRIKPDGSKERVAGGGSGEIGSPAAGARVGSVTGLALGPDGKVYLSEQFRNRVLRFQPGGNLELVAGTERAGLSGDGGPATEAQLSNPVGLSFDAAGNLYIADRFNSRIRKVTADGTISTFAGNGEYGCPVSGPATAAEFGAPAGVSVGPDGAVYAIAMGCGVLTRIAPDGQLTVLNGGGRGFAGDGGPLSAAQFHNPQHVDVTSSGEIFIADTDNSRIRRVAADMTVSTVAGKEQYGGDGGPATQALFYRPADVALDSAGRVVIADTLNHRLRRLDGGGVVQTIAGTGEKGTGGSGGPATAAQLEAPETVGTDAAGNVYVGEDGMVRRVGADETINLFAGTGAFADGEDGGPAIGAQMGEIRGIAETTDKSILLSDVNSSRVRRVDAAGVIHRYAGTGISGYGGDGGPAIVALLNQTTRVAAAPDGGSYILDSRNRSIRQVAPDGTITTYAGIGEWGYPTDGEPASTQALPGIAAIAANKRNELYIADYDHIWKVSAGGVIRRIAGAGDGYSGDGGPALDASFEGIRGMVVDEDDNIYVADSYNHRIRKLSPPRVATAAGKNTKRNVIEGTALPDAFQVVVTDAEGNPIAGVPVSFAVTSGSIGLESGTAFSNESGVASIGATSVSGTGTVTAVVAGQPPISFEMTAVTDPNGLDRMPAIRDELGVVGAGLSHDPVETVSPGAIVSIFGDAFAAPGSFRGLTGDDVVDNMLPTKMGGVCVMFGEQYGYMMHVLENQINVQAPALTPLEYVDVRVIRNCGEPAELYSGVYRVQVMERSPEFFYWTHPAEGVKPVAAVNPVTGQFLGAPNLIDGVQTTPAKYGDLIDVYMCGLGAMDPAIEPGAVPGGLAFTTVRPSVYINGNSISRSNIVYHGATQYAGVYLLRIQIPAGPDGFPERPESVPEGYMSLYVRFIQQKKPTGVTKTVYLSSPVTHLRIE